jgi:hypothetical protein
MSPAWTSSPLIWLCRFHTLPPRGCFGVIQKLDSFLDDNDLCFEQFLREEKMCSDYAEILSSGFLELPCYQTVLSGALKS